MKIQQKRSELKKKMDEIENWINQKLVKNR